MTVRVETTLWQLIHDQPEIDSERLAEAIEQQIALGDLDYRSRLLIRRSIEAIRQLWTPHRYRKWLEQNKQRLSLEAILNERFSEDGFPFLAGRVVMTTQAETARRFLRELGDLVPEPTRMVIGGSMAAILTDRLNRHTEDIDVPDEVPAQIRACIHELERLAGRYQLRLTHFQSHYLPEGWKQRVVWFGDFDRLTVYLVDLTDLFVGKLYSRREKDIDDLRILAGVIEKGDILQRLQSARNLQSDLTSKSYARKNWYIIYGEQLPNDDPPPQENAQ